MILPKLYLVQPYEMYGKAMEEYLRVGGRLKNIEYL